MIQVYISTAEAGRRLGISTKTVMALMATGELYGYPQTTAKAGRVHAWKIAESSIDAYVRRQQLKASA